MTINRAMQMLAGDDPIQCFQQVSPDRIRDRASRGLSVKGSEPRHREGLTETPLGFDLSCDKDQLEKEDEIKGNRARLAEELPEAILRSRWVVGHAHSRCK